MGAQLIQNPKIVMLFRVLSVVVGITFIFLAVNFYNRTDLARDLWPWSYTTMSPLSYTFLSSIAIAIALPVLWIGIVGEFGGTAGGALNLAITFGGALIFMFQSYQAQPRDSVQTAAIVCGVGSVLFALACFVSWSLPFKDARPMAPLARRSFAIFGTVLIIVGSALAFKQQLFPWRLSTEAGVIYGWIFLGAASYFWYGFFRPVWGNAIGQFLGFLAYDLVLIDPFLRHFGDVQPSHRISLIIYLAVIFYSAGLAIYYLFFSPETRLWKRRSEIVPG